MKTNVSIIAIIILSIALASCGLLQATNPKVITPSDVIISENRPVSSFSKIEFSTLGKMNIIQGDTESLNVSGPDNLVSEIDTRVRRGTLIIRSKEDINVNNIDSENTLTFTIVVKNLTSITTSGLGDVQVDMLSTPSLSVEMSGSGFVQMNHLTAESLELKLSGVGGIAMTGDAQRAKINLSGAGSVNAPDLMIQDAEVTHSGVGEATIWVTNKLTGDISGIGDVNYYGNPQTNVSTGDQGGLKSLGSK